MMNCRNSSDVLYGSLSVPLRMVGAEAPCRADVDLLISYSPSGGTASPSVVLIEGGKVRLARPCLNAWLCRGRDGSGRIGRSFHDVRLDPSGLRPAAESTASSTPAETVLARLPRESERNCERCCLRNEVVDGPGSPVLSELYKRAVVTRVTEMRAAPRRRLASMLFVCSTRVVREQQEPRSWKTSDGDDSAENAPGRVIAPVGRAFCFFFSSCSCASLI